MTPSFQSISKWQRSKQTHLQYLERHEIAKVNALNLTTSALIDHVRNRRADGTGPSTVLNDLVWIGRSMVFPRVHDLSTQVGEVSDISGCKRRSAR